MGGIRLRHLASTELAKGELTFDRYAAAGHVIVRPANTQADTFEAWFIKRFGIAHRNAVFTYEFSTMPILEVGTELIATAKLFAKL